MNEVDKYIAGFPGDIQERLCAISLNWHHRLPKESA